MTGAPAAVKKGRFQPMADQIYADYVANDRFRPLVWFKSATPQKADRWKDFGLNEESA